MKMTAEDLAKTLRDMASRIETGDSWEGSINYTCLDEGCDIDEFLVKGAYRIGNTNGQGGMRLLRQS